MANPFGRQISFFGVMAGLIILLTLLLWIWALQKAKERHRNLQEAVQSPSTADLQCPKLQQLPPIIIMQPDNEVVLAKLCGGLSQEEIAPGLPKEEEERLQKVAVQNGQGILLSVFVVSLPREES